MPTQLEEWSVLEGKTLLHIEAPNGVTILSMAKKRRVAADMVASMPTVLTALFAWRSADVHHAALVIGARHGDEDAALAVAEKALTELRILTDRLHEKAKRTLT